MHVEWPFFTLSAPGSSGWRGNVAMLSLPEVHRPSVSVTEGETDKKKEKRGEDRDGFTLLSPSSGCLV